MAQIIRRSTEVGRELVFQAKPGSIEVETLNDDGSNVFFSIGNQRYVYYNPNPTKEEMGDMDEEKAREILAEE